MPRLLTGPSIDSHFGFSGTDDGSVCIHGGISFIRARLRRCRAVCRYMWFLPIIGAMFADLINTGIISLFLHMI